MYRRSDNSESPAPSRTAITGQQDNLPREGIISEKNTIGESHGNRQFNTREMNVSPRRENSTGNTSRRYTSHTVIDDSNRNYVTRAIPTTGGLNRATNTGVHNSGNCTTQEMRAMSRTQRIPGTPHGDSNNSNPQRGGSAPYLYGTTAVHNRIQKRRPPLKVRLLRFIGKYSTVLAVICACFLFFAISVPLMVFALGDPTETDQANTEAVYEINADNSFGKDSKDPSDEPDLKLPIVEDSSENSGSETKNDAETTPDETPDETTDETPSEESTEDSTDKESASETTEAETEDPNAGKFQVTIAFYDREAITCYTEPATLRQILAREGCVLKDSDRPTVNLDDVIEYQSWIMINSVSYKQVTESEIIPFETVTYESDTVPRGTVRTASWGVNGSKERVYTVEYVNGKEVSRTFQYEYIASNPTNQIDYYGVGGTFTASDGTVYSYSHRVEVRATYYNIHGNTYTGMPTGHNVVAVDPNVFPLGTEMYVIGGGFDMGYRVAADIGGAVKGNLIDIWMDETNPDYFNFAHQGVVNMTAYVLG